MALVLAGLLWGASDPWKTKPFMPWDANDLRKVMNDSPWAKLIEVPATWKPSNDAAVPGNGGLTPQGSSPSPGSSSAAGGRGPAGGGGAMGGGAVGGPVTATEAPTASCGVRWSSSRTFRAAALRSTVQENRVTEADAEKQLQEPQKYCELAVVGRDMQPFQGLDEETLKASTFLVAKKAKQKVSPESVHIDVGADGKTVQGVTFSFPKTSKTGEATLGADEKEAEFSATVSRVNIKASFDFAKMEDKNGRDL
jgi:hypothetical protein